MSVGRAFLPPGVRDGDGLRQLVAEPDVVHDEAVELLLVSVGVRPAAVRAGDGLEQRVGPQRLVEVHTPSIGASKPVSNLAVTMRTGVGRRGRGSGP